MIQNLIFNFALVQLLEQKRNNPHEGHYALNVAEHSLIFCFCWTLKQEHVGGFIVYFYIFFAVISRIFRKFASI